LFGSTHRTSSSAIGLFGALTLGLACWATSASAGAAATPPAGRLDTIVVTAQKKWDPVIDEKLTQQVAAALHNDRYFLDDHVTVTVKNGVAYLEGIVFDDWDVRVARRIARKIPGVRRVVTDFYVPDGM
jgi:osmotically-inducible protein OsmY